MDKEAFSVLNKYGFYPYFLETLDVDRLGNDKEYLAAFRGDLDQAIQKLSSELEKIVDV